jgi:hypothetical protein
MALDVMDIVGLLADLSFHSGGANSSSQSQVRESLQNSINFPFCEPFLPFFHIFQHTYIHSITFIRHHSPGLLSISVSLVSSVGKTSLWCQAEN